MMTGHRGGDLAIEAPRQGRTERRSKSTILSVLSRHFKWDPRAFRGPESLACAGEGLLRPVAHR